MSHATYAGLSGAIVGGAWAFSTPLSEYVALGEAGHAGAGFVLGVVVYSIIFVLHTAGSS